jgi:hypothetical protein
MSTLSAFEWLLNADKLIPKYLNFNNGIHFNTVGDIVNLT